MKISELVAALTAELIRGNDADIGLKAPVRIVTAHLPGPEAYEWRINGDSHYSYQKDFLMSEMRFNQMELRHRADGVMEIVLT